MKFALSFNFSPAPLGVAHDTHATRPTARPTAPPCLPHTRRTCGTGRAEAYEAGFVFRVVVVASSSVRPVGCSGTTRNTETIQKRSALFRNATKGDSKSPASGLSRRCLAALFYVAMRPLAGPVGASIFLVSGAHHRHSQSHFILVALPLLASSVLHLRRFVAVSPVYSACSAGVVPALKKMRGKPSHFDSAIICICCFQ